MTGMTSGEWLKAARKHADLKQLELAKSVGVSEKTLRNYENGVNKPDFETLKTISTVCNFSLMKLLGDNGNNLPSSSKNEQTVEINFYDDIFASAGYGNHAYENQPAVLEFDKSFLENILNIKKFDRLDIIRVVGDSMLPSIKDGEYIIVERDSEARNGDTVIANIDGELYVKRLSKIPLSPYIILESENENYRPIELDTDEKLQMCNILGVVRCKIKLY